MAKKSTKASSYYNVRDASGRFTTKGKPAKKTKAAKATKTKTKKETTKKVKNLLLENIFILDSSGSMGNAKGKAAVTGYNEMLDSLKKDAKKTKIPTNATLVVFTHDGDISVVNHGTTPVDNAKKLQYGLTTGKHDPKMIVYLPNGGTPLSSAIVETIQNTMLRLDDVENAQVNITIFTDGEENMSKREDKQKIKALIQMAKRKNYSINFIGAGEDLKDYAVQIGVEESNTLIVENTERGIKHASARYMKANSMSAMNYKSTGASASIGFFSLDEDKKKK